jgi:hypothetical protein
LHPSNRPLPPLIFVNIVYPLYVSLFPLDSLILASIGIYAIFKQGNFAYFGGIVGNGLFCRLFALFIFVPTGLGGSFRNLTSPGGR